MAGTDDCAGIPELQQNADAYLCWQVVKYFEQILYATDEAEAKECMLEAQKLYTHQQPGANGGAIESTVS